MSWYTYLYPTDFDYSMYNSPDELQKEIDNYTNLANSCWTSISCMAVSSPGILFPNEDRPLQSTIDLFNKVWDEFLQYSFEAEKLYRLHQYWETKIDHDDYVKRYPNGDGYKYSQELGREMTDEEYKEHIERERADWKAYVWYNHFEYSDSPEHGIEVTEKYLNDTKNEILMLCTSDKSSVMSEESQFECPFDAIQSRLLSTKEWVNDLINENYYSQLCKKYWDTKEEG